LPLWVTATDSSGASVSASFLLTLSQVSDMQVSDTVAVTVALPPGTIGVHDGTAGIWYLRNSNSAGAPDFQPFAYGAPGWIAVVGDWDGDGTYTPGVVDPVTMTWYLRNSNSAGAPDFQPFTYGAPGWTPVVGDWDGDGIYTPGVIDPVTMTWYLRNSNSAGAPDFQPFAYGASGWIPLVGDWDGDGITTIGVLDPATATWYLRNQNVGGAPDFQPFAYGAPGWTPVVGDWDGDGTTTAGVLDPATATWYLKNANAPGAPDVPTFVYGGAGWRPLAGVWASLPDSALLAAGGPGVGAGQALPQAELDRHVAAALQRLEAAGLRPAGHDLLDHIQFQVIDLPGRYLGLASPTGLISLDGDAYRHGWFLDPTPLQDEEFSGGAALPGGEAAEKMDLLTAVLYGMGQALGLSDSGAQGDPTGTFLAPDTRRLEVLTAVFAQVGQGN
jgi:cell wall assembly regulator SMI1